MRRFSRSTGTLLIATGVLHALVGLSFAAKPVKAIVDDGVFNAVDPHPDRQYWFWFMVTGWLTVLIGQLTRRFERRGGTPPAFLGWHLLALSAVGAVLMPISGLWLLIPQGILVLRAARRREATPRTASPAAVRAG